MPRTFSGFRNFKSIHKKGAKDRYFSIGFSFKRVSSGRFAASYGQNSAGSTVVKELRLEDSEDWPLFPH